MNKLSTSIFIITFFSSLLVAETYIGIPFKSYSPAAISSLEFYDYPFINFTAGSNCTGTWINNSGTFITSAHCFDRCLLQQFPEPLAELDYKNLVGKKCPVSHFVSPGGLYRDESAARTNYIVEIVAVGSKGWLTSYDFKNTSAGKSYIDKGYDGIAGAGDFLIMKLIGQYDRQTDSERAMAFNTTCLNLSNNKTTDNGQSKLYSASYPDLDRKQMTPKDPLLYITSGVSFGPNNHPIYSRDQLYYDPNIKYTSADAAGGSSGASLFTNSGDIAGVIFAVTSSKSSVRYLGGASTLYTPSSFIYERLTNLYGRLYASSLFNKCNVSTQTKKILSNIIAATSNEEVQEQPEEDLKVNTNYGFSLKENVDDALRHRIIFAFGYMERLQFSKTTPHHKQVFGEGLAGKIYMDYLSKLKSISYNNNDSYGGLAYVNHDKPYEVQFFPIVYELPNVMDMLAVLIHEAGHLGYEVNSSEHIECPARGLSGKQLVGYLSQSKLEGSTGCDNSRYSSYAIVATAMSNIAMYCTSCSEKEKHRASFLADEMLERVVNKAEYDFLLRDRAR